MARRGPHDPGERDGRGGPDRRMLLALAAIWVALVAIAGPVGDFPLNDDWAYGWTVKTLLETGTFQLSDWTATNLLPQALWGALFSLPSGFSFTALRLSTLTLGLVGVLATYGVLRQVGGGPSTALIGALLVALNPLYFVLAHSFSSDVPSFALALTAMHFLLRGLDEDAPVPIGIGIAAALIATMNRQSGFVILPVFGLVLLLRRGAGVRNLLLAILPSATALAFNALYPRMLEAWGHKPVLFGIQIRQLAGTLTKGVGHAAPIYLENLVIMTVYVGLFLLPFLALEFPRLLGSLTARARRAAVAVVAAGAVAGGVQAAVYRSMPFAGNVLLPTGVGPLGLPGYNASLGAAERSVVAGVWTVLTILGAAGAGALLLSCVAAAASFRSLGRLSLTERGGRVAFLGGVAGLYLAAIAGLHEGQWFDRYLIMLLPLAMAVTVLARGESAARPVDSRPSPPGFRVMAVLGLVLAGIFTVAAAHDYLAWNRARWRALNELTDESRISPRDIDGGFEFHGWHFGQRLEDCAPEAELAGAAGDVEWEDFRCLWPTQPYRFPYAVAFLRRPGYAVLKEHRFRRWLPWRQERLLVLRRSARENP